MKSHMCIGMIEFYPDDDLTMFNSMFRRYACNVSGLKVDGTQLIGMQRALRALASEEYECTLEWLDAEIAGDGMNELCQVAELSARHLKKLLIRSRLLAPAMCWRCLKDFLDSSSLCISNDALITILKKLSCLEVLNLHGLLFRHAGLRY